MDDQPAFFIAYLVLEAYHAPGNCGKDYLRQKDKRFVEEKRLISSVGLN